jgi:disulfide bond formation protein DsbB
MNFRLLFLGIFATCVALLAFGLYLEHVKDLEPCPLCILQRYAFVALGLTALVGVLHHPGRGGKVVYGLLAALVSGAGIGVAMRHVWIQHHPGVGTCGPGLEYMLDKFPLTKAVPMIFKGHGECAEVGWRWLGMTIPEWSAVWFALFMMAGGAAAVLAWKRRG